MYVLWTPDTHQGDAASWDSHQAVTVEEIEAACRRALEGVRGRLVEVKGADSGLSTISAETAKRAYSTPSL